LVPRLWPGSVPSRRSRTSRIRSRPPACSRNSCASLVAYERTGRPETASLPTTTPGNESWRLTMPPSTRGTSTQTWIPASPTRPPERLTSRGDRTLVRVFDAGDVGLRRDPPEPMQRRMPVIEDGARHWRACVRRVLFDQVTQPQALLRQELVLTAEPVDIDQLGIHH